jgi:predicted CoA-substrate-specific enzyme activase
MDQSMKCVLGIDMGSASAKGVLVAGREVLAQVDFPSGGDFRSTADRIKEELLAKARVSANDISSTIATGFGAKSVSYSDSVLTDLSCHAKGIHHLCPAVRTAVDAGDLYSKAFRMDEKGNLLNFLLSGKCAGGSARILKVVAKVLQLNVEDLGDLALKSRKHVEFNTGCAVFAESEAISRIAEGISKEDLLAGIHRALAAQLNSLAVRLGIEKDFALVGGGARNSGLVKALEAMSGFPIVVPPKPHMTAALGAALIASENVNS